MDEAMLRLYVTIVDTFYPRRRPIDKTPYNFLPINLPTPPSPFLLLEDVCGGNAGLVRLIDAFLAEICACLVLFPPPPPSLASGAAW
jgi:hypothetical protein